MNTYNVAVCMPAAVVSAVKSLGNLSLHWSGHARRALLDDRYGQLPAGTAPRVLHLDQWALVEATAEKLPNGSARIEKFVVRRAVDSTRDLVLVVRPERGVSGAQLGGVVVTAWINLTTDVHRTLDASKFATTW